MPDLTIEEIVSRINQGETQSDIAQELGVSRQAIGVKLSRRGFHLCRICCMWLLHGDERCPWCELTEHILMNESNRDDDLALLFKKSESALRKWRKRAGYIYKDKERLKPFYPEITNPLARTKDLAKKFNTHETTIHSIRQRHGINRKNSKLRREWTKEDELRLIEMRRKGKSAKQIAKALNRTLTAINLRLQYRKCGKNI